MDQTATYASDVAFTECREVDPGLARDRALRTRAWSKGGSWEQTITPDLKAEIEAQTSVFSGHRQRPRATLHPTPRWAGRVPEGLWMNTPSALPTLPAIASTSRKAISKRTRRSTSSSSTTRSAGASRSGARRVWWRATMRSRDRLMPADYRARPEQVLLFTVAAWDVNCPQHIPQRFEAADVQAAIEIRDRRIAQLEAEVADLRRS